MFTKLSSVLDETSLSITMSKKDDVISVTIIPTSKKDSKNLSNTPLVVSGTAKELDSGFADKVAETLKQATSFLINADSFIKAAKEKEDTAKKAPDTKTTTTSSSSKSTTKPTKEQATVIKNAEAALEKAKKEKDQDRVIFLRNQHVKLLEGAKVDAETIKTITRAFDAIKAGNGQKDMFKETETVEPTEEDTDDEAEPEPDAEEDDDEETTDDDDTEDTEEDTKTVSKVADADDIF